MPVLEPGWYADPLVADQLRLWDGHGWTEQTQPESGDQPSHAFAVATPPEPGWYPDANSPEVLRMWDGAEWTGETQNRSDHTVGERPDADRDRRRRRLQMSGAGLAAVAVVSVAIVALSSGGSRPSHNKQAPPTTTSSGPQNVAKAVLPAPGTDCTRTNQRPNPVRVLNWLRLNGINVGTKPAPAVPAGACAAAAFTDPATGDAANSIVSYPTAASASAAVGPRSGQPKFAINIYVVTLDPALRSKATSYQTKLTQFVALTGAPGG